MEAMTDPTDEFQRLAREAGEKAQEVDANGGTWCGDMTPLTYEDLESASRCGFLRGFLAGADFGRELGKPEGFQMAVEMLRNEGRRGGACLAVSWADWLSERGPK